MSVLNIVIINIRLLRQQAASHTEVAQCMKYIQTYKKP